MLMVKVEEWPGGDGQRRRTIGTCRIGRREGTAGDATGNYTAVVRDTDGAWIGDGFIDILNYPRRLGAWELVRRVLAAALPPEEAS